MEEVLKKHKLEDALKILAGQYPHGVKGEKE